MDKLVRYAPALAIAIVTVGLVGYAVALVLAAFFPEALGAAERNYPLGSQPHRPRISAFLAQLYLLSRSLLHF